MRKRVDRFHTYVRRLCVVICVLVIALVAIWFFVKNRANEMIRSHIEDRFNDHYAESGIRVSLGSARLIEGEAIILHDLSFKLGNGNSRNDEVVHIGEIVLTCDVHLHELLITTPQVSRVRVRRLKLLAERNSDGAWSFERLLPFPSMGDSAELIPVSFWDSSIEILNDRQSETGRFKLTEINLSLTPSSSGTSRTTRGVGNVASATRAVRFKGSMEGSYVRRISFNGSFDLDRPDWEIRGEAADLEISQQLRNSLPSELRDALEPLSTLRARLTVKFKLQSSSEEGIPITFAVHGKLKNGQIDDPRLPYPLTDIQADLACDNTGIRVKNMTARSGQGKIKLDCNWHGFGSNSPLQLTASFEGLVLNNDLRRALPEPVQLLWAQYNPSGTVDAKFSLTYDGTGWSPDLELTCIDVSFAYYKFPYRFENCRGTVSWNQRLCNIDLEARANGRRVTFDGKFFNPGDNYTGTLTLATDGPIPLDEDLTNALAPHVREALLPFHPHGKITFSGKFTRQHPHGRLVPHLKVGLQNCSVNFDSFPYPIDRIYGTLELIDRQWTIRKLEGHNDRGFFTCDGTFTPNRSGGNMLEMSIIGTDIPLEEELRLALAKKNRQAAKLWSDLRPRGSINRLRINLRYETDTKALSMDVQAQKWRRSGELEGRSMTIEPVWFPYRLDDVAGLIELRDGKVTLHNISGVHGKNNRWFFNGVCSFSSSDWTLAFDQIDVRRLHIDDEFIAALPPKLGDALSQLKLRGLVSIHGALSLSGNQLLRTPASANWNLSVDVENGSMDCGVQLEHIHGGIEKMVGRYDGHQFQSRGNLHIDSVIYKGVQLTEVIGPIWMDDSRVALGVWAQPRGYRGPPKPITARLFGGLIEANAQVIMNDDRQFHLQATLKGGDLATFSRDVVPGMRDLKGTALVGIRLKGSGKGVHTFQGNGYVRISDAQMAEIPVLLAMLKLLTIRQPNRTAFNASEMDFRIHGDHLYFDKVNFSGDAISLRGMGSVNLNRDIDLTF
ncbi:MAG: hypothetical protein IH991_15570, partial [Planctomycetes bacterium]|nr:hypothetical protein [Planctomycetota bacterium]